MEKKKNNQKIIIISIVCVVLVSILIYFTFINSNKDFRKFNFNDGRMGGPQLTSEIESEITSFFESSPSDLEIENYCLENPMYCGYYCRNSEAEFCENFKFERGIPKNETSS